MTLTLNLSPEVVRKLAEKAAAQGQTVEAFVTEMVGMDARGTNGATPLTEISDDEFEKLLDELSAGPALPVLPADFSRADIYSDHD